MSDPELRDQLNAAITALGKAETELAALRQIARGYCPACGRGDAAPTVADWEQQRQRAEQAEAALARVRALHVNGYGLCDECTSSHGVPWPCPTIRALDGTEPAPTATEATHTTKEA